MVCLGWFSVYALRYLPSETDIAGRRRYLAAENMVVLASVLAGVVPAMVTAWSLHDGRPLWLNTSGAAVAWLHVRLDSSPKYYRHREYAMPSPS